MTELKQQIIDWHKSTFPSATFAAKRDKLLEECRELMAEIMFGNMQSALEEVADIFIVAASIAADKSAFEDNVTMSRIIADKLAVNKASVWGDETENGDRPRVKFFKHLPVDEVVEAMEIATQKGLDQERTVKYFCGVCWGKIRG